MKTTPYYQVNYKKYKENCLDVANNFKKRWGENIIFGYSVKTNRYVGLINYAFSELGWFIEVVNPNELNLCRKIGIPMDSIIINGPCKSIEMFDENTARGIFNIDNESDLEILERKDFDRNNLRVGIRVNFDLEKDCPNETTAGNEVSRFGVDCESNSFHYIVNRLCDMGIRKIGVHMHTSTRTRSIAVFNAISRKVVEIKNQFNLDLDFIDIGGGFLEVKWLVGKPLWMILQR